MKNFNPEARKLILIAIICGVAFIYVVQLFRLQILSSDYKTRADKNAFYSKTLYPSRGVMYDRNGELLAYSQSAYDVLVIVRETEEFDTLAFCRAVEIPIEYFRKRLAEIKDRRINPSYSSYTPQTFLTQLSKRQYGLLQESIYKFPGFHIQDRPIREYNTAHAAHVLGYIAETDRQNLAADNYYQRGDLIGKTGVEASYEKYLRGQKGVEVLLRDAHGRIQDKYENGAHDIAPVPGKDLTLTIDIQLQACGEQLMQNKLGTIVAIEPQTGEILCLVSSPTYDPASLSGRQVSESFTQLANNPYMPLLNRALHGTYPPGSTFKTAQALAFLQENIITPQTAYSCFFGWPPGNGHPACHGHHSPLTLAAAIGNSCNAYFAWGLKAMLENKKYHTIQNAIDTWRDYMVAQGLGYPLGIDLPGEKRGLIPNSEYYDSKARPGRWNAFSVITISIGQGEVALTPIQICNLAATIANRGHFYTPHIVKKIEGSPLDSLYLQPHATGIDPQYYNTVVEGMRWAVTGPGGTAHGANIPDIAVCGKTGTAQNSGRDHSIAIAFAPMDNPQIAILAFVENGGFGATNAVPICRLMIQKYLKGAIPPADQWLENQIKNTTILRNVSQKN